MTIPLQKCVGSVLAERAALLLIALPIPEFEETRDKANRLIDLQCSGEWSLDGMERADRTLCPDGKSLRFSRPREGILLEWFHRKSEPLH